MPTVIKNGWGNSSHLFRTMGTEAYIEIVHEEHDAEFAQSSIARAVSLCFEKVRIFNRFDPESELSKCNRSLRTSRTASPDMSIVARHALEFYRESKGLFDPRVINTLEKIGYTEDFDRQKTFAPTLIGIPFPPMKYTRSLSRDLRIRDEEIQFRSRMDFSGIAKGYILDRMAELLARDGWENFLIDAGGDIRAHGCNATGSRWKIALENIPEDTILLGLSSCSIATSGVTRRTWQSEAGTRFHHLIHPRHPHQFDFDILSVSAIAETSERADFLAKMLFFMRRNDGISFAEKHLIPAVFIGANNEIHASSHLSSYRVST